MTIVALCCLAAFVAGFVDAIAGGGGIITMPTLLMLNLPLVVVIGTNKLVSPTGTAAAAITYIRDRKTTTTILAIGVPLTALGSLYGASLVSTLPTQHFKPFLVAVIFVLALYFFFRPRLGLTRSF